MGSSLGRRLQRLRLALPFLSVNRVKRQEVLFPFTDMGDKFGETMKQVLSTPIEGRNSEHYLIPDTSMMDQISDIRKEFVTFKEFDESRQEGNLYNFKDWLRKALTWRTTTPPIKNATLGGRICIVGVHGWFPTKMLQTVVGVPKGTSSRLCKMMEETLREFIDRQPLAYFERPPRIDCLPLEGSGCIDERTELHYSQLNVAVGNSAHDDEDGIVATGKEIISRADSVIFVAHSQGAPVAALLAERLLSEGILKPEQNVGMLTLAAVFHGPFPNLKENLVVRYVEADAARELFDLNDPHGILSTRIQGALTRLLARDVVLCTVASWLDQVVPLYSASLLGIDHPGIWRSVYIDGHNYRGDFLTALVRLLLGMVNGGVSGARVILGQLSESLAGSIYQSNAHSTLYDDYGVYECILKWMTNPDILTTGRNSLDVGVHAKLHPLEMTPHTDVNPYILPWLMRGLLSVEGLVTHPVFGPQLRELQRLHREWRPDKKVWKELKMQLEPLTHKL